MEGSMGRALLWRKDHIWYRFARRRTRELRRFCIALFSVVMVVGRVIEFALKLLSNGLL